VLKSASQTPFTALAAAVLAEAAGIPEGLVNVITGSAAAIGEVFTASPVDRKLTFTASTEIGAKLYEHSAPTIKALASNWAATNPPWCSTTPTSMRRSRARWHQNAATPGKPSVCQSALRAVRHPRRIRRGADRGVGKPKVGNCEEEDALIGPLIDEAAVAKAQEHVDDVLAEGGKVEAGGKALGD
jgi:succinate-semialdehyde dehydrogenase/glutarate-semialdehyde dehydrogenase